jgi:hypothetical protein
VVSSSDDKVPGSESCREREHHWPRIRKSSEVVKLVLGDGLAEIGHILACPFPSSLGCLLNTGTTVCLMCMEYCSVINNRWLEWSHRCHTG